MLCKSQFVRGTKTPAAKPRVFEKTESDQALNEKYQNQNRQNPLEEELELRRELETLPLVCLGNVLVKAPAPFRDAEQKIHQ